MRSECVRNVSLICCCCTYVEDLLRECRGIDEATMQKHARSTSKVYRNGFEFEKMAISAALSEIEPFPRVWTLYGAFIRFCVMTKLAASISDVSICFDSFLRKAISCALVTDSAWAVRHVKILTSQLDIESGLLVLLDGTRYTAKATEFWLYAAFRGISAAFRAERGLPNLKTIFQEAQNWINVSGTMQRKKDNYAVLLLASVVFDVSLRSKQQDQRPQWVQALTDLGYHFANYIITKNVSQPFADHAREAMDKYPHLWKD